MLNLRVPFRQQLPKTVVRLFAKFPPTFLGASLTAVTFVLVPLVEILAVGGSVLGHTYLQVMNYEAAVVAAGSDSRRRGVRARGTAAALGFIGGEK